MRFLYFKPSDRKESGPPEFLSFIRQRNTLFTMWRTTIFHGLRDTSSHNLEWRESRESREHLSSHQRPRNRLSEKCHQNPKIFGGDFAMYNDLIDNPRQFEKNNVLCHYPINHDKLIIEEFCSIACGVKFCSPATTIHKHPCPPIRSRSFLKSGDWMSRTYRAHGTITAVLSWATMCRLDIRQ